MFEEDIKEDIEYRSSLSAIIYFLYPVILILALASRIVSWVKRKKYGNI